jgi:hypothetical protein
MGSSRGPDLNLSNRNYPKHGHRESKELCVFAMILSSFGFSLFKTVYSLA